MTTATKTKPECVRDGCTSAQHTRGECSRHYQESWRNNPNRPKCAEPGCANRQYVLGMCSPHYQRARRKAMREGRSWARR